MFWYGERATAGIGVGSGGAAENAPGSLSEGGAEVVTADGTQSPARAAQVALSRNQGADLPEDRLDPARLATARERAGRENGRITISARAPVFLDRYLDTYVSRINVLPQSERPDWLRGRRVVHKQDLLTEALALFAAAHELPPAVEDEL